MFGKKKDATPTNPCPPTRFVELQSTRDPYVTRVKIDDIFAGRIEESYDHGARIIYRAVVPVGKTFQTRKQAVDALQQYSAELGIAAALGQTDGWDIAP